MTLPTLSVVSEFPYGETVDFDVIVGDSAGGMVPRYAPTAHDKRVFRLTFNVATKATKDEIVALFRQVRGRAGRFNFTPPGGSPVVCRFTADELPAWQKISAAHYATAIEFMEA